MPVHCVLCRGLYPEVFLELLDTFAKLLANKIRAVVLYFLRLGPHMYSKLWVVALSGEEQQAPRGRQAEARSLFAPAISCQ